MSTGPWFSPPRFPLTPCTGQFPRLSLVLCGGDEETEFITSGNTFRYNVWCWWCLESVLERVLPFFFLRRLKPPGVPNDEPTNSLFGVHPTVTKETPCEPRQFAMGGVFGKVEEGTFGRQFQTLNRNDSDRRSWLKTGTTKSSLYSISCGVHGKSSERYHYLRWTIFAYQIYRHCPPQNPNSPGRVSHWQVIRMPVVCQCRRMERCYSKRVWYDMSTTCPVSHTFFCLK